MISLKSLRVASSQSDLSSHFRRTCSDTFYEGLQDLPSLGETLGEDLYSLTREPAEAALSFFWTMLFYVTFAIPEYKVQQIFH